MSAKYNITGMSCAACSARIERVVKKIPGVESCAVSLLTNSMNVEGSADSSVIIAAVEKAGYGASVQSDINQKTENKNQNDEDALADKETPRLKKRLFSSLIFLVVLMYFSMGRMLNLPLPEFFADNPVALGLAELLTAAVIMVINQKFFVSGFSTLAQLAPNMDTLVAVGASAAFLWSVFVLFVMTKYTGKFTHHDFYFESAGMILTLITVGKMLEARSKGRTTDAIKSLIKLAPKTANLIRDGKEISVPVEQVKKGDVFVIRPGENIPVDGVVIEGTSAVNESALTGESIPVDKNAGDYVSAATLNQSGFLKCEASRVGEDTTLSQIIKMVSDAAATKAPVAKTADKVCGIFVPSVIFIAVCVVIGWLIAGKSFGDALSYGIAVLVISCPCALGLATPAAVMVGSGVGAKNGILFKTAASLEQAGKIQIAALDKTGTITSGEPEVTNLIIAPHVRPEELISAACSLEAKSEHPLAKAIVKYADEQKIQPNDIKNFQAIPGNGLKALLSDDEIELTGGSVNFIKENFKVADYFLKQTEELSEQGKTPLMFVRGTKLLGAIAVADVIKPDSKDAIKELKDMGIKVVMLTGDNEKTARAIADEAGADEVIAGVLPDGKENAIRELQSKNNFKVAMVGDGINDAPALTRADTGIAIGAGTDIAIDAADVVLMKSSLKDVPAAVKLSRAVLRNIHENLFWAFIYNVIGIPLAAGLWGWKLDPMFGAAAMSLSSFCVVTNALRLNFLKLN